MSPRKRRRGSGSGRISRRAALALIGGGGLLGLTATGAFSAVQGNRRFDVGVGDDDQALLQLVSPSGEPLNQETASFTIRTGNTVPVATITNAAGETVTFDTLSLEPQPGTPVSVSLASPPGSLGADESVTLRATATCDRRVNRVPVTLDITATSSKKSIELSRRIEVTCSGSSGPSNPGACTVDACGNTQFSGDNFEKPELEEEEEEGEGEDEGKSTAKSVQEIKDEINAQSGIALGDEVIDPAHHKRVEGSLPGVGSFQSNTLYLGTVDTDDDLSLDGWISVVGEGTHEAGKFDLSGNAAVAGDVEAEDGQIDLTNATVVGTADAGLAVSLANATVCGYVKITNDSNRKKIDAQNSAVGGAVETRGQVDLDNTGVAGNVDAGQAVTVQGNSEVCGSVTITNDSNRKKIDLKGNSTVRGDLDTRGQVDVTNADVSGGIDAGQAVSIQRSDVGGPVTITNDSNRKKIQVTGRSKVEGSLTTRGEIQVDGNSEVTGDLEGNKITVQGNSSIESGGGASGDLVCTGQQTTQVQSSTIEGTVRAEGGGSVEIKGNSTVEGDVVAASTDKISVKGSATVEGEIRTASF